MSGKTMDFPRSASQELTLLGHTSSFADGVIFIGDDLRDNIRRGDENYLSNLDQADEFVCLDDLDFSEDPEARKFYLIQGA